MGTNRYGRVIANETSDSRVKKAEGGAAPL